MDINGGGHFIIGELRRRSRFGDAYVFLLRARDLTAVWIAGMAGFAIGSLMWLTFSGLLPLLLDQGVEGVWFALTNMRSLKGILWPGGVLGAIAGLLFWLIARPDRQSP